MSDLRTERKKRKRVVYGDVTEVKIAHTHPDWTQIHFFKQQAGASLLCSRNKM